MPRSPQFAECLRALRIARACEAGGLPTGRGLRRAREAEARRGEAVSRRAALGMTIGAVAGAVATPWTLRAGPPRRGDARIAIVGAGLAGLTCADALRARGLAATIYEASSRVGGRCSSIRGLFPGQTAELGGEFIDTTHQTMRRYAVEFGLAREDVRRAGGEPTYFFGGRAHDEAEVVDQYRRLVPRLRADLRTLSGEPTFFAHAPGDVALDRTDLATYLATRAGDLPLVRAALDKAYVAEYGLETSRQSALNMLLFLHADRRSKFRPFGVFSDERFHLAGGNDAIAAGIAARLPGPIEFGRRLTHLRRNRSGEFELVFEEGPVALADSVVLTLPFTVLRAVELHESLGLSPDKRRAIATLGYGANAKTMISFQGRPWADAGSNGSILSDLPNVQNTWETSPLTAGATSVLTDYAGGDRGAAIGAVPVQAQAAAFLADLDVVIPGAAAAATRLPGGEVLCVRAHWPSNPLSLGSYTCYEPGQFTGLAGLEARPAGRLKFAGEHTDSFYSWQGFMEGACLSGLRAAGEVIADLR